MKSILIILAFTSILLGCAGPFEFRKTIWTADEVTDWYNQYQNSLPELSKGILYQGTDQKYHHFIAHLKSVDNWAIMKVDKTELEMSKVIPYIGTSSSQTNGYFVDPSHGFKRMETQK